MKNRYSLTLFIFLKSKCFEFYQNIQSVKAEDIKKSFYTNGYTFEESFKLKNQILSRISFKNKKNQYLVFSAKY